MNRINIITPTCIRDVELLPKMIESCRTNLFEIKLWIIYDYFPEKFIDKKDWIIEKVSISNTTFKGNTNRNLALREIPEGELILYMDSDNKIHEDFFEVIKHYLDEYPDINMFVFNQNRMDGNTLIAKPENMTSCKVDGHQVLYKHNNRLWEEHRTADGILLEQLYSDYKDTTIFITKTLCYHNYLVNGKVQ